MTPIQELMRVISDIGWENFTPDAAAKALDVETHQIPSKKELLKQFHQNITEELRKTLKLEDLDGVEPLDCIMEIMLCRLELLSPYRAALKRIYQDLKEDPCLLKDSFTLEFLETDWMIPHHITPPLPSKILSGIYWLTVRHWLKTEPENVESAMSYLDKTLRWIVDVSLFTR